MQDFLTTIATATEIAIAALVFLPLAYRPVKASQAALQPRKMTQTDDVTPTIDVEPVQVETPAAAEILAWEPLEISPIEQRAIAGEWNRNNPDRKLKGWNSWAKARLLTELQAIGAI